MDEPKITVPIDIAAYDRLVSALGLQPGTYTVVATSDKVTIQGVYVDYQFARYPEMTGLPGYTPGKEREL